MNWRKLLVSDGLFSAKGLLLRAALVAVAYGVAHAAGWREYTSILCGTAPGGDPKAVSAVAFGVAYVILHFAFVIVVPVLLLAATLLAFVHKLFPSKKAL